MPAILRGAEGRQTEIEPRHHAFVAREGTERAGGVERGEAFDVVAPLSREGPLSLTRGVFPISPITFSAMFMELLFRNNFV